MSKTIAGTDGNFEVEVVQADGLVLVDFWAPWCGPCRIVGPILEEIAEENDGKVKVVKVNVDENRSLQERFQIRGIPTMMFFKGGEAIDTATGVPPNAKEFLQSKIDSHA